MKGGVPTVAIPICGESPESACGTSDDGSPEASNPYDCTDCDSVTIFEFEYNKQLATASPTCQGVFTFPEDYGDVYYNSDGYLYDAFGKGTKKFFQSASRPANGRALGNQIGDASCDETAQGKFQNPWNSVGNGKTQPTVTPCATCYHAADPDACPYEYNPGWCYCNDETALYPILSGNDPCGYTVMPTTTTTSPICTPTD